ncbi:hypothetical protein [Albidovulum sp.]|uniref:hypothetical protein n=1 Tax=Albidovulum sp. TaxID=1872424 RepID=UPI0039B89493
MFRFMPLAAALLAGTVATATMASVDKIAKVDVTADLGAIQNEKAANYWSNLEKDLEAAIGARVSDRLADKGAEILVDIEEVELANAFERELNLADAVLVGKVNVNDQTENSNYDAYILSISLENAHVPLAPGEKLILSTSDTAKTYQRLVDEFADGVVARLK